MRFLVKLIVLIFVIAVLIAWLLPSFFSTQFGKNTFFKIIKQFTDCEFRASHLKLQWLKGQSVDNIEVLDREGRIVFKADSIESTASLWKLIFYHDIGKTDINSPFIIMNPPMYPTSHLRLQKASFQISYIPKVSYSFVGDLSVIHGKAQFNLPKAPSIWAKEVTLKASFLPQNLKLDVQGITEEENQTGSFALELDYDPRSLNWKSSATLDHFPLKAADQTLSLFYPHFKGALLSVLGDTLSANINLKNLKENVECYIKINSDRFSALVETELRQNVLTLSSVGLIQFQVPYEWLHKMGISSIKSDLTGQIRLDELTIPLQDKDQFAFQGVLRTQAVQINNKTLDPLSIYLATSNALAGNWDLKIDSADVQFNAQVKLPPNFPSKMQDLSILGQALVLKDTKVDIAVNSLNSIHCTVQGPTFEGELNGSLQLEKSTVSILSPTFFNIQIKQFPPTLPPLLQHPVIAHVTFEPCAFNFQKKEGFIKGEGTIDAMQLGIVHLSNTSLQFSSDLKDESINARFQTLAQNGHLNVEALLQNFSMPSLKLKGSCDAFPIESIEPLLPQPLHLKSLLGSTFGMAFDLTQSAGKKMLDLDFSSDNLKLKGSFNANDKQMTLLNPLSFTWSLTPQAYQALTQNMSSNGIRFELTNSPIFNGLISSLKIPLDNSLDMVESLRQLQYQFGLESKELSFTSKGVVKKIQNLKAQLSHDINQESHFFELSADASPEGRLDCNGFMELDGTSTIKLSLSKFPSEAADFFMAPFQNNPKPWMSLCGPSLNMSMMTSIKEWNGPIQMQFLSQNVQSSIKGHLKEGYLTLSDPFYFQMQLTSQMSDIFFKSIESISYLRSTAPITLTIQPEGFVLPVKGFDMSQIQMSTGRLEIGQLEAKNEGSLQTALGILKMGQYRPGEIVPLWFAPLDFTIREGQMNCERTELLIADSLQVCLWGRINLQTDSVDAIFGLTSSCLDQAFGIKDLPKDYVLQIPVRGTLADLQVNKSKATAKIGTLLLWQQRSAAAGLVKGPGGAILGEIMSKIGPIPGGNEKAPPAKRPFPWEATHPKPSKNKTGYLSEDKDRVENRNRKLIKPSDSAIKQALKLIR